MTSAHKEHDTNLSSIEVAAGSVRIADATVTRLDGAIHELPRSETRQTGRRPAGMSVQDMFDTEREGAASKISELVDKVDSHVAEMEKRLTDHSAELTDKINSVRRGTSSVD